MKKSLFFEQEKPLTVKILGVTLLLFVLWFVYNGTGARSQLVAMSAIGFVLLGYSVSYEITRDFKNRRHFKLFGLSLFKSYLKIKMPDYMVVFSAKYKQGAEWGPVGALGKDRKGDRYVIRLFKGNQHFTVYKTGSLQRAKTKAMELSELIQVEIRGKN